MILLVLCLIGASFWTWNVLVVGRDVMSITNFDLFNEFLPRHRFAGESLRHGVLPLWDPHQIGGLPFLATYQAGVLYPPNLLYALMPTGAAMGWLAVLHALAAGAAIWALCREFGRSRGAAALGAIVFMLGGATLFMSNHTNAMNSVPWLPASVYCAARLLRGGGMRWAIALAMALALQFLAGREYTFVMTAHTVGFYVALAWLWSWWDRRDGRSVARGLGWFALAALLAGGLVAVQALPTLQLAQDGARTLAGLDGDMLEIYDPMSPSFLLANLTNPVHGPIRREYFGWIPLVCFVFGFSLWDRDRPVVFASALAVFSLLLCFGSLTPVYALYRELPLGSTFRLPDRFIFLFGFALALVAAKGFDRVREAPFEGGFMASSLRPRLVVSLVLLAALPFVLTSDWLAAGLAHAAVPWRWFTFYGFDQDHFVARTWAVAYFVAALVAVLSISATSKGGARHRVVAGVVVLAVCDLAFAQQSRFLHPAADSTPAVSSAQCYERVEQLAGRYGRHYSFRVIGIYGLKDKDGELFGRYSVSHYDPLVTTRQARYFEAIERGGARLDESAWGERSLFMGFLTHAPTVEGMKLLDMLSTRVFLADGRPYYRHRAVSSLLTGYPFAAHCRLVGADPPIPIEVRSNPDALPRVLIVHEVGSVTDEEAALRAILAPEFDPRREAVVEGPAPQTSAASDPAAERVVLTDYEPTRVVVQVVAQSPGLLVLTDTWDPDWRAEVAGREVPILVTNAMVRGVAVPAGSSRVVFRYRPRAFVAGAWISGFTAVAVIALGVSAARRERAGPSPGAVSGQEA